MMQTSRHVATAVLPAMRRGMAPSLFSIYSKHNTHNTTFSGKRNMSSESFQAWRVQERDGQYHGSEQIMSTDSLPYPDDGTLVRVTHSSLNYKDALSASGNKGVTKNYPHTPGIDAAGICVESGESVMVTGYDLGMNTDGGFGEYIRVPKEWVVSPMPFRSAKVAMVYGTAGLTAGLCVQKILGSSATSDTTEGKVVAVTGATGSVGSVAVELLSKLGFDVVAISGKTGKHKERLLDLGAKEVLGRETLAATKKPLLRPMFDHAIDTLGGTPLAELLKYIQPGGSVAICGLVAGPRLETTVLPFILRGINLLGVDSVEIPLEQKKKVWNKLATSWSCPITEAAAVNIGRHELDERLEAFLKGESAGKFVLNHSLTR